MASSHRLSALSSYIPTLPTPFDAADAIDIVAFERFCERQIDASATALVVCGTTGEASNLSRREHELLVRIAVAAAGGKVPVIAGAGSNSTAQAIELSRDAERAGANAVLSVVPYYNKPTQSGMYAHFQTIATSIGLPVILHDVPSRTVCGLADDTIARLAELRQMAGLADASADVTRPLRLRQKVGSQFRLLSGDDATALAFFAHGGDGCVSTVANVAPGLCRAMHQAWAHDQGERCRQLATAIGALNAALARESDPAPLKYALATMRMMSARLRLPLVEPSQATKVEVDAALTRVEKAYPGYLVGDPAPRDRGPTEERAAGRPHLVVVAG